MSGLKPDANAQTSQAMQAIWPAPSKGEVWFVGAGPGHPMLITRYGMYAIMHADVILYDALVDERLLNEIPPHIEKVFVGKRAGKEDSIVQPDLSGLLVRYAQTGRAVVRLKGGDPFVFGRGGEEMNALRAAGIRYRIIPGVTAANGALSWLGIPLTERMINSSVTLVSAMEFGEKERMAPQAQTNWEALTKASPVLVFYMVRQNIDRVCAHLLKYGRHPDEEALILCSITMLGEQVFPCTIASASTITLPSESTVLFVVGSVCSYWSEESLSSPR